MILSSHLSFFPPVLPAQYIHLFMPPHHLPVPLSILSGHSGNSLSLSGHFHSFVYATSSLLQASLGISSLFFQFLPIAVPTSHLLHLKGFKGSALRGRYCHRLDFYPSPPFYPHYSPPPLSHSLIPLSFQSLCPLSLQCSFLVLPPLSIVPTMFFLVPPSLSIVLTMPSYYPSIVPLFWHCTYHTIIPYSIVLPYIVCTVYIL